VDGTVFHLRPAAVVLAVSMLAACGSSSPTSSANNSSGSSGSTTTKSAKRGIAYDLSASADLAVLSPGVSWWYNWTSSPNASVPSDYASKYGMEYDPMLWNFNFNAADVEAYLQANPSIKYLLVLNEPNITGQANVTPQQAAQLWPQYEAVAAQTGVKIVGPAMTWGNMTNYNDPVVWLDSFYVAYETANGGRQPQIDYLAFHWYDYGLSAQLDSLDKYNKQIWVTEFANWHSGDAAAITTLAEQEAQMDSMVTLLEGRSDVFRYAWFTGRLSPDPHFTSVLGATGQLTGLGTEYLSLPTH
jgi:hypothetical protein